MAKKLRVEGDAGATTAGAGNAPASNPLNSEAGKRWLHDEMHKALNEVRKGPSGLGWKYNEAKRAAIEERAAFISALYELTT